MASGTSRAATGEPQRRIRHALAHWEATCFVHWKRHCAERLLKEFDQTRYSQKDIARLMHEYVEAGGEVREQDETSGEYDEDVWYSVVLTLDGTEQFIKFVLRPDEPDEPGIVIVRFHVQQR